jgi:cell division protein FtsB|tara:strand:- start:1546 stop:1905 length:360 start_codon:yes stop_codon:yes gene_type:complete
MSNRSFTGLIKFINKNKLTLVLIVILFSLIKQNIFTNNFPYIVLNKQKVISDLKLINNNLINQNVLLESQVNSFTEEDSSLIESKARFKYGLIKEGEYFFKINKIIETDNLAEISDPTL